MTLRHPKKDRLYGYVVRVVESEHYRACPEWTPGRIAFRIEGSMTCTANLASALCLSLTRFVQIVHYLELTSHSLLIDVPTRHVSV
jgi:hypothetical protein